MMKSRWSSFAVCFLIMLGVFMPCFSINAATTNPEIALHYYRQILSQNNDRGNFCLCYITNDNVPDLIYQKEDTKYEVYINGEKEYYGDHECEKIIYYPYTSMYKVIEKTNYSYINKVIVDGDHYLGFGLLINIPEPASNAGWYKREVDSAGNHSFQYLSQEEFDSILRENVGNTQPLQCKYNKNNTVNRDYYFPESKPVTTPSVNMEKVKVTAVYNSAQGADIRWQKVNGSSGYVIYRQRLSEGIRKIATISNVNAVQCYDSTVQNNCWGKVYHYYVYALYGNKEGPRSDPLVLQRLAPMTITSATSPSVGNVSIKWICSANSNKALGYEIQYATSKEDLQGQRGSYRAIPINGRNNLSKTVTGLSKGKTYYFRIRCYTNYTNSITWRTTKTWSQYSNVINVKTMSAEPRINLSSTSSAIVSGNTVQLRATLTGATGSIRWRSSNTYVAIVSSTGLVTAKNPGTAVITASSGNLSAKCMITVKAVAKPDIANYLDMNVYGAAAALGWKRITNYGGNSNILFSDDGDYKATSSSYIGTESYSQYNVGQWNAVIRYKKVMAFGLEVGMKKSEVQGVLRNNGSWRLINQNQFGDTYMNNYNSSGILISYTNNKINMIQYLWRVNS